ncbi:armadillo-type protein [Pisolithus croceorrhizus]|nr:armadillo-type protein [Pisolithus croceorrhizus]
MIEEDHLSQKWQRDYIWDDWQSSMHIAQSILLSSSTKLRLRFIREELQWLADEQELSLSQTMDVFKLLTRTYPRYVDAPSREAVEALGMLLINRDESRGADCRLGVTEQVVDWLVHEVSPLARPGILSSHAPADAFVLLSWACGLYIVCSKFPPSDSWRKLVGIIAVLVDFQLNPSTHSKLTMQKSALVRTRRALRSAPNRLSLLMSTLVVQAKSSQTPLAYIPLLGLAVDVTLRLKDVKEDSLSQITPVTKGDIATLYSSAVLMSKGPVSPHTSNALHDFIQSCVDPTMLSSLVLPVMEKALLRSPEYSLSVTRDFFLAYSHFLDIPIFRKLLTSCLNSAKSSNATTRANTSALFKVLANKVSADALESAVPEILALPQAGKTTGPDHRATLYAMLSMIQPNTGVSLIIVKALPPLILKETNDTSITILSSTLPPHLTYLLQSNIDIPVETQNFLAKEMESAKPALRKSFVSIAGATLWNLTSLNTEPATTFVNSIKGSLEANLKSVSTNPLSAVGGLLEGYVPLAVLLGPLSKSGQFADLVARNTSVETVVGTPTKPSFLIWEKVYQRLGDAEEEMWLLRCLDLVVGHFETQLLKNENLRIQFGFIFLHLAVQSPSFETRRTAIRTLQSAASRHPNLVPLLVKESLLTTLTKDKSSTTTSKSGAAVLPPSQPAPDSHEKTVAADKHKRHAVLLLACAAGLGSASQIVLDQDQGLEAVNCTASSDPLVGFVVLAHHATISPASHSLWIEMCQKAGRNPHDLVQKHIDSIVTTVLEASMVDPRDASYRTVSTLAFVLRADIDVDFGIYETPEGTAYADGKGADIAKWEAELRQSLASKKGASQGASSTAFLSRQAQALLQAQLDKEAVVRQRVISLKARLQRALALTRGLVSAKIPDTRAYVSSISAMLLEVALAQGSKLVGNVVFETFIDLACCCSERLDTTRRWVGIAILRALQSPCVPQELLAEPLHALVLRVLYRLRTISEQAPFDLRVLHQGGIDVSEDEEALEQVALVLDIIRFHTSEFMDTGFPRKDAMEHLVHVIKLQPRLSKEASSRPATYAELSVQETHVRNSCLQAIQNARLANHAWEDNGLDVPEGFLGQLLPFLEHANPYVRASSASAIADAKTIVALQDLYRDKAKILSPEYDEYGMIIPETLDRLDPWPTRQLAPVFPDTEVEGFIRFLIQDEALGDRSSEVRRAVVDHHGSARTRWDHLAAPSPASETSDQIKEAVARHLGASDLRIHGIVDRLVDALKTPAEQVQVAVSDCPCTLGSLDGRPLGHFLHPSMQARRGAAYAAQDAARVIMGNMSGYGVKLILPSLLSGLDGKQWRSKKGSIELLGMMAYCSPRQLSLSLPIVIPRLTSVLTDTHAQVKSAANKSLKQFGELVPTLLKALVDPAKTTNCFVIPVIERGLRDRGAEGKKKAAQIRKQSGVDRQGAAQGLSEVLSGLGMERLEGLLPDIIANAQSPRSTIREGFMSLLVYLPATFGARFQPHLPKIISPILSGLADSEEYVRDAAMRAGRMIVVNYSSKAIDLLLPELEQGMFDPGWRIRQSSITLVGELLFKVSGISGKTEIGDEEEDSEPAVAESSRRALVEVLGEERRDRILSALYVARQDAVNVVRQSSVHIWKALVHNTPRTVRGILPELVNQLIKLYSGGEEEQQETAARTTLELCRKFGEKLVGEIVAILKNMSASPDTHTREGVCLMLSDIMQSTTDTQREGHESDIVSVVRASLVDDDVTVRSAAARAHIGGKAIDQIIPTLLEALRQPGESSGTALQALREVMSVRSGSPAVFPASLVTVAGNALSKRLTVILNALVKVFEEDNDEELLGAIDETLRALLGSIEDPEGLNTLMLLLLGCTTCRADFHLGLRTDAPRRRAIVVHTAAWKAFDTFVKSVPKDEYEQLVVDLTSGRTVPGFSLPKGAYAIGDLVERTDELVMKSFVVPFTGPLIRVATQATTYPPGVKTSILSALASLLERIPNHLQRTFAAQALGILMRSQPRVDPVPATCWHLSHVVRSAQAQGGIGEKAKESCTELLHQAFRETHDDHYTLAMASLFVSLSADPESVKPIVSAYLLSGTSPSALSSQSILAVFGSDDSNRLDSSETVFAKLGFLRSIALKVKESAANERPIISRPAREAREFLREIAANGEPSLAGIF